MDNCTKSSLKNFRKEFLHIYTRQFQTLETTRPWGSVVLYVKVYLAILLAFYLEAQIQNNFFTLLSIIFIAGRQHSLYILNHDASHHALFKKPWLNTIVSTILSNCVMFHHPEAWSFIQWRRIHLLHHRYLFTMQDPNYVGRKRAGDTQMPLTKIHLIKSCLYSPLQAIYQFFLGKQNYVHKTQNKSYALPYHFLTLFLWFKDDPEMAGERYLKLGCFFISILVISYFNLWRSFLLLWILPMYSFYPMVLRWHDLTEHYWGKTTTDPLVNTRSVKLGYLAKIFFSFLPRGFHREHHLFPQISVKNLPKLALLLRQDDKNFPPVQRIFQLH